METVRSLSFIRFTPRSSSLRGYMICFVRVLVKNMLTTTRAAIHNIKSLICSRLNIKSPYAVMCYITLFSRTPMSSISHLTVSPGLRNTGGFMLMATPPGVPVAITVPAASVIPWDSSAIASSMVVSI